jgi:membrane protein implicated in regulation of membrane protease activity
MKGNPMDFLKECLRPEVIWFFVGLFLLFAELVVPGLIIAFFAFGAWVVAAVSLGTPLSLNQQLALFVMSSVLSLALARSWLKSIFSGYVSSRSDGSVDLGEFVGQRAVVVEKIVAKLPGRVEFHGTTWLAEADVEIPQGAVVEIQRKDNLTLKVKPV